MSQEPDQPHMSARDSDIESVDLRQLLTTLTQALTGLTAMAEHLQRHIDHQERCSQPPGDAPGVQINQGQASNPPKAPATGANQELLPTTSGIVAYPVVSANAESGCESVTDLVPAQRQPQTADPGEPAGATVESFSTEQLTLPPPAGAVWPGLNRADAANAGIKRRRPRHAAE